MTDGNSIVPNTLDIDPKMTEETFLRDLYQQIGERLCELNGHLWRAISFQPAGGGGAAFSNGPAMEKCRRCGETRPDPDHTNSTLSGGFTRFDYGQGIDPPVEREHPDASDDAVDLPDDDEFEWVNERGERDE